MKKIYIYSQKDGWLDTEGLFLFENPVFSLEYKRGLLKLNGKILKTNPLLLIEKLVKNFNLYAVGFISYDFGKDLVIGKYFPQKDDLNLLDIYVLFFKNFKPVQDIGKFYKSTIKDIYFNTPKEVYIEKIKRIKEYIANGDIYQVNFTHRIDLIGEFHPKSIFKNLINIQKTPFLMYIEDPRFSIISASMELFLKKIGNRVTTKPIKGTRKRGKNPEEDRKLFLELKNSEKEIAENLMITDLMRNDLGRIAKRGKVKTTELFEIGKYETLFQMYSTVEAEIEDNINFKNIIYNTFPPGSVTGAPKKRAMEIIAELEDLKRTVYCGATVLIKPNLDFVSSVAIRQTIFKNNKAHIYVGGGITAGSDPIDEYNETLIKAVANLRAIDEKIML